MAKKNSASKTAVWVLLLLLIVGLAGFGATNFGGTVNTVGSVGDREITVDRYVRELRAELNQLSQQFGTNFTLQQAQMFGIDQAVLQRILSTVALENEAERIGVSVGDDRVRDQILEISAFQGVDGQFDREGYRFALQNAGLSESDFEEGLRYDLSRNLLQDAVKGATEMPEIFADTLLTYTQETRDITWAALTEDNLETPVAEPTEDELRAYWEANSDAFMLPETRDITYAWLTPEMIAGTIEGDDAVLKSLYEERIDDYRQPERRLVERLVFASAEDAQAAKDALDAGDKTFEDLVAERDLELSDIDLGDVTQAQLGSAGDAVFGMDAPGVVGPIETDLGPALFRMNGILQAQETTFEEARDELLGEYRTDAARRAIGDMIDGIDDLLAGGATLEELADETEMETGQIDWTEGATEGIAAYPEFRQAALDTNVGDFPEVITASDGAIFALRVNEVVDPRVEPFEEAHDKVAAEWRRVKTVEALAEQARALADTMGAAGELPVPVEDEADAAAEDGAPDATAEDAAPDAATDTVDTATQDESEPEVVDETDVEIVADTPADTPDVTFTTDTAVTRTGFIPDTPTGFVDEVFKLEVGETKVIEGVNAAYLVRLDAIHQPDLQSAEVAGQATQLNDQVSTSIGDDILAAFAAAIQAESGITLNQAAINAVHAQFQ